MFYLLYGIIIFLFIVLVITIFNLLTAPLVSHGPLPKLKPYVSVLIPCRNEESTISRTLDALLTQSYASFEILVLDDHSTDKSSEIIKEYIKKHSQIKLLNGSDIPNGWTGKNWACYQLAQKAKGDILIFTDADNFYSPKAISNTIGWMEKLNLAMFSAFPQQITKTLPEKLVVPIVDHFVFSFLPLWLTYYMPHPSLSAANGQWIAIDRNDYFNMGGHKTVKNEVVEDVELCRLVKKNNGKVLTASGRDCVYGHMYNNFSQVWYGFSKNIFGLVGFKTIPFIILLGTLLYAYVFPYLLIFMPPLRSLSVIAILINVLIRSMVALKYKHPLFTSVVLHPFGSLLTILIGINSIYRYHIGYIYWKDRKVILRR